MANINNKFLILIKFLSLYLLCGWFGLSKTASCDYRSRKFLKSVTTKQSLAVIIKQLTRGADVNYFGSLGVAKDIYGWHGTALHWAAKHNKTQLVDLLLTHGANKAIQDSNAKEAFRYAQHKKLKCKLRFVPTPGNLAEGLGFGKHRNIFADVPVGWDMGDIDPNPHTE